MAVTNSTLVSVAENVASCSAGSAPSVSSYNQIFVSGLFPNTFSKLNGSEPIPCFTMFTFTVVSANSAGAFAGALNKPAILL